MFKIFSDYNRIRIYHLLVNQPLCVCELEVLLNLSQPSISKHLTIMKKSNIVVSSKNSLWSVYQISPAFIKNNPGLAQYLVDESCYPSSINDDLRLLNYYLKNNLNHQLASKHKEEVIKILHNTKEVPNV
ncbi:MAG: ArsR/SmtB family transcription factor [Bacilli bacterium]